jgi:hypothetical protein
LTDPRPILFQRAHLEIAHEIRNRIWADQNIYVRRRRSGDCHYAFRADGPQSEIAIAICKVDTPPKHFALTDDGLVIPSLAGWGGCNGMPS